MCEIIEFHGAGGPGSGSVAGKMPNTSSVNRRFPNTFSNFRMYSAGILPRSLQLQIAPGTTPHNRAAAPVPPTAMMVCSTVRSFMQGSFNPRNMEKSSAHKTEIEDCSAVKLAVEMGTRDEIMARLRQLPGILDKTDAEIAETCGVSPTAWSNYKSVSASENVIRPMVALELWNAYGIPMEWVYDGQTARVPDADMRTKLAKANRAAELWLASRRPGPRRGPGAHIAVLIIASAIFFASYANAGHHGKLSHEHRIEFGRVVGP